MNGAEWSYLIEAAAAVTAVLISLWRLNVHNRGERASEAILKERQTKAIEDNTAAIRELTEKFNRYVETTREELETIRTRLSRTEWQLGPRTHRGRGPSDPDPS